MKYLLLILSLLFSNVLFCQIQFGNSIKGAKLKIKMPPPDSVSPVLIISKPLKKEGFPIYSKEPIYSLSGISSDNSGKVKLFINDKLEKKALLDGNFRVNLTLSPGSNSFYIKTVDKRNNLALDSVDIVFDPKSDVEPPIIKIMQPVLQEIRGIKTVPKFSAADSNLYLKGKVFDESDLLGIWINGKLVGLNEHSEFYMDLSYNFPDSVVIEAADIFGNMKIERFLITPEDVLEIPDSIKYHAFIAACNDYLDPEMDPLKYPIRDAEKLINVITASYLFDKSNVLFLRNPTRETILDSLQKFGENMGPADNVLIFFAGHGTKKDEKGYWIPSDGRRDRITNWISNSEIKDYIKQIKSQHTLIIADACFSATLARSSSFSPAESFEFSELYKYPSRRLMSSGSDDARVSDKSKFVENLIEKLEANTHKLLTGKELLHQVKTAMEYSGDQIPQYLVIKDMDDKIYGDFIFIKR